MLKALAMFSLLSVSLFTPVLSHAGVKNFSKGIYAQETGDTGGDTGGGTCDGGPDGEGEGGPDC